MSTNYPAHLTSFQDWLVGGDGKALGTAKLYSRFLVRCAEHYNEPIDEQSVRTDADVDQILRRVGIVVAKRDRWARGTFNKHDLTDNLAPALRGYARFVRVQFPSVAARMTRRTEPSYSAASVGTLALTEADVPARGVDVPMDELPPRLRIEVSRIVRDTKIAKKVKSAHEHRCQICAGRLELAPGRFYSEGHHLKPLGAPHNGPDVEENILCVCPTCHVKLDFNAVQVDVAKLRRADGHEVGQEFIAYHNERFLRNPPPTKKS